MKEEEESGEPSRKAPRLAATAKKVSFNLHRQLKEMRKRRMGEEAVAFNEEEERLDAMLEQLEEEKQEEEQQEDVKE